MTAKDKPKKLPSGPGSRVKLRGNVTGAGTKLTPERYKKIIEAMRQGNYGSTAAALAGIHADTLSDWTSRGRKGDVVYAQFAADYDNAVAEAEGRNQAVVQKAAIKGDWRAATWWLERKLPRKWGERPPPTKLELTGKDGSPVETRNTIDFSKIPTEELMQARRILAKAEVEESSDE